jgi:hypothetical protein
MVAGGFDYPYMLDFDAKRGKLILSDTGVGDGRIIEMNTDGSDQVPTLTFANAPMGVGIGDMPASSVESAPAVLTSAGTALDVTWSDCGDANTLVKVSDVTPSTLPLGASATISGAGTLSKDLTGAVYDMTMTGVGGINLLQGCSGDGATDNTCKIGAFGVSIGTLKYSAISFPQKAGKISGIPKVEIQLPKALPKFVAKTTTTLKVKSSAGENAICVKIMTA